MKTVDRRDFEQAPARWLEFVAEGNEVVITENEHVRARLVGGSRTPGLHRGKVWLADDFNAPLPDAFWTGDSA